MNRDNMMRQELFAFSKKLQAFDGVYVKPDTYFDRLIVGSVGQHPYVLIARVKFYEEYSDEPFDGWSVWYRPGGTKRSKYYLGTTENLGNLFSLCLDRIGIKSRH
ncbi:MAG: hypothetical protein KAZ30_03095 [Candidatus Magasanikbacteria bacterium]|nr:hypothetical protein [Candidatus Magasanikbacteria bacterium]